LPAVCPVEIANDEQDYGGTKGERRDREWQVLDAAFRQQNDTDNCQQYQGQDHVSSVASESRIQQCYIVKISKNNRQRLLPVGFGPCQRCPPASKIDAFCLPYIPLMAGFPGKGHYCQSAS
jgi:hypothetical protein